MTKPNAADRKSTATRWTPARAVAWRIAIAYAVIGVLWILGSGWLLHRLVTDDATEAMLENVKGWFYVLVTAALLGLALDRYFAAIRRSARLEQASEQRWRFALEGAGDGLWDWDTTTNEVFYSDNWKAILGYAPHEIGTTLSEWESRVHPEDLPRVLNAVQQHLDGITPGYQTEHRLRCRDGSYKWVLDRGKVMSRTPEGKPLWMLGTHSDITKRKQAEALAAENEERLRQAIDAARMGTFDCDLITNRVVWSRRHEELWGLGPGEFAGTYEAFLAQLHPEDLPIIKEEWDRAVALKTAFLREFRVIWPDGSVHWIASAGEFAFDPAGRPTHLRGLVVEVTQTKQVEAAIRQSEAALRALVDAIPESLFLMEGDGTILAANDACARRFQRNITECTGGNLFALLPPELIRVRQEWVANLRETQRAAVHEEAWGDRWLRHHYGPILNDRGEVQRIVALAVDITDRKKAEEALRQSELLLRTVIDTVPHLIFAKDRAGRRLLANQACAAASGMTPEQMVGRCDLDFVKVRAQAEAFMRDDREVIDSGKPKHIAEEQLTCTDGRTLILQTIKTPFNFPGVGPALVGVAVDITEQKRMGEEIRFHKTILEETGRIAKVGGWRFDPATGAGIWTDEVARIHDLAPGTPITREIGLGYYAESSRARIEAAVNQVVAQARPYDLELELVTAKGVRKWVRTIGHPVLENGRVVAVNGSLQDITERKQAETALREREQQLQLFITHSPAAIAMLDRDLRYVVTSRRWLTDFHLEDRDLIGRTHYEIFPEIPERWKEIHRRCLAGAVEKCDADAFPRADGSVDWLRWEVRPWRTGAGEIGGLIVFSELITERKQAEAALAEAAIRRRVLLEQSRDGIVILAQDGKVYEANQRFAEMLGYTPEETQQLHVWDWDPRFSREELLEMIRVVGPAGSLFETRHRRKDGSIYDVEISNNGAELGGQKLVFCVCRDITARKQAEAQLQQLSRAVEQSPAMIVITNLAAAIQYVNPKFTQVTGYTLDEVRGKNPRVLKSGELPVEKYRELWATILQGREWHGEFHNKKKNGELYWELALISPITSATGEVTHFVAVKEDITARKRLENFRQALLPLGVKLNSSRDAVGAARAVLAAVNQLWKWDAATLDLLSTGATLYRSILNVDTVNGVREEVAAPPSSKAPTARMKRVMQSGAELVQRSQPGPDPEGLQFGDTSRFSASIMCVPIRRENHTVGILSIQSYTPNTYTEDDLQTLQALGDYCGAALDRIRFEEALLRSEERYRLVSENGSDVIWLYDLAAKRFAYISPSVERLRGFTVEEAMQQSMPESLSPESYQLVAEHLPPRLAAFAAGDETARIQTHEVFQTRKDGSLVATEVVSTLIPDAKGQVTHIQGASRDITERKRAAEALRRSEERFRRVVEAAPEAIFVRTGMEFAYLNQAALRVFGATSADQLIGRPVIERFHPDYLAEILGRIKHLDTEGVAVTTVEQVFLRMDGSPVPVVISAVPFIYQDQKGALVFARDMTEHKRLESQFRQAQKLEGIGQLAGGVAHDFNNILAGIMMHLGLLQMTQNLDATMQAALKELETETQRAATLTRQLLMFSRRSVLAVKPVDLNTVVTNLLKLLGRLIGEHIDLRFDGRMNLPLVEADAGMLEQVLLNLVVNARDAIAKGGRISIATRLAQIEPMDVTVNPDRRAGRFLCLTVSDNGCGMDGPTLKHIFEPFFTTKEAGKGTGLGLATVHGIVAQHKGWLEVESEVGLGSTFLVYLPVLAQLQPEAAKAHETETLRRGQETILLVEDDAKVRRVIGQSLRVLGYRVFETGNGQEAMTLWQTHGDQVDLLLTDMVMPEGMTGLELTEKVQALKPGLKAIISSGYSAEIVQAGVPNRPGVIYLPKPYEAKILAKVVRDCLDQKT